MINSINSDDFEKEVIQSVIPVIVDFWAPWCGPCKLLNPILEEIEKENNGKFKIVKIDIDDCQDLAKKYNITLIPTLKVFKNGQVVDTVCGLIHKDRIKKLI